MTEETDLKETAIEQSVKVQTLMAEFDKARAEMEAAVEALPEVAVLNVIGEKVNEAAAVMDSYVDQLVEMGVSLNDQIEFAAEGMRRFGLDEEIISKRISDIRSDMEFEETMRKSLSAADDILNATGETPGQE